MKKKYQVFISSTYADLKEERMAVTQCLLDNDLHPCWNGTISSKWNVPNGIYKKNA